MFRFWTKEPAERVNKTFTEFEKNGVQTDLCVLCHGNTGVPTRTPVQSRRYYVEGAGQLCAQCYRELYARQ